MSIGLGDILFVLEDGFPKHSNPSLNEKKCHNKLIPGHIRIHFS